VTSAELPTDAAPPTPAASTSPRRIAQVFRSLPVRMALALLAAIVVIAIFAPHLGTSDPTLLDPGARLKSPSAEHLMGTDALGRDVYSRVMYGARVSLAIGLGVALASVALGLAIGVVAGYFRTADAIVMRIMDGLMAIPGILLAIALVSLWGGGIATVVVAITIPETPRVVRLVRSVIISIRGEPYVEAATALGTPVPTLIVRHMVPNTIAPLIVQGTFVLASAMLTEAAMSFLGVGLPPEIPSWGSIMAEGRTYFQLKPGLIFFAGAFLAATVLAVNIVGDAVRDALDPRMAKRA
jgi:peptide/nickel transport system permease protein